MQKFFKSSSPELNNIICCLTWCDHEHQTVSAVAGGKRSFNSWDTYHSTSRDIISQIKDSFRNFMWLLKLIHLGDIFDFLNDLNQTLRDICISVIRVHENIESSTEIQHVKYNTWAFCSYKGISARTGVNSEVGNKAWLRIPFTVNLDSKTELSDSDYWVIIELSFDTALQDIRWNAFILSSGTTRFCKESDRVFETFCYDLWA